MKLTRNEELSSEVEWRRFSLKLTRNEEVSSEEIEYGNSEERGSFKKFGEWKFG